jgi:drug/metabolite transporter (DMT)-like permease
MNKADLQANALMLLATVLIATSFPVGAAITHGLDPIILTLLRFCLAAVLFAPYVARVHGLPWPGWRGLARYAVISACMVGFFWGMFTALRYTSVLNTATIFTLAPAITAAVSAVILRERLAGAAKLALPVGIIGAVWVIFRGDIQALLALDLGRGDVIFLAAICSFGCYTPILKLLHRGEPMAQVTFWTLATGAGWLACLALTTAEPVQWADVPVRVYGGIAYLAIFTTLITFFIYQKSVAVIGPTRVMSFTYLNPALVLIIGLIMGDALPPLATWPGLVLIIGATVILQRPQRTPRS